MGSRGCGDDWSFSETAFVRGKDNGKERSADLTTHDLTGAVDRHHDPFVHCWDVDNEFILEFIDHALRGTLDWQTVGRNESGGRVFAGISSTTTAAAASTSAPAAGSAQAQGGDASKGTRSTGATVGSAQGATGRGAADAVAGTAGEENKDGDRGVTSLDQDEPGAPGGTRTGARTTTKKRRRA